jgi:hypothetical protein
MTEETENLVLEMLRRIRASQERSELDVADLKVRTSALEQHIGQVVTLQGQVMTLLGTLNQRMDRFDQRMDRFEQRMERFDERLDRIERRLDPVGA